MHIGRAALVFLTVAALLLAGGTSIFCTPSAHGVMKCCKTPQRHGQGMKQPDCCRFVPASTGQVPAGVETSPPSKISRDEIQGAALEVARVVSFEGDAEPQASAPLILPRELSVPLYLLNTSLLR